MGIHTGVNPTHKLMGIVLWVVRVGIRIGVPARREKQKKELL